jgi:hypothetical protein
MKVSTTITIKDTISQRDAARMQTFMLKLAPVLVKPKVIALKNNVAVQWHTTDGTIVEASAMWFPMLLGCWLHINRTLQPADIDRVLVEEQ